jgi:hypothetical protein
MGVSLLLLLIILKRVSNLNSKLFIVRAIGPLAVCIFGMSLVIGQNIDKWAEIKTIQTIPAGKFYKFDSLCMLHRHELWLCYQRSPPAACQETRGHIWLFVWHAVAPCNVCRMHVKVTACTRHRSSGTVQNIGPERLSCPPAELHTALNLGACPGPALIILAASCAGLPKPTASWWFPMPHIKELASLGIVVMLVDLLESTSIAKSLARKNGYDLVPNQEIVGLGLANFAGSLFHAYTTTGSFSR